VNKFLFNFRWLLSLAFVALATNANSQSKYVLITPDSLNNPVRVNYAWNWHILPLSDSTYYVNTWGFVDTNVIAQVYMFSNSIINEKNRIISNYRFEFDTNYGVFPALINSLTKLNSDSLLCLNAAYFHDYASGIVTRQMCRIQLVKLNTINSKIWSHIYGDTSKFYNPSSVKENNFAYYIGSTRGISVSPAVDKQFCLIKTDENGNQVWEKVYPFVPREYLFDIHTINGSLYLSGNRVIPPYYEERNQHIIKKVDTNGNLLLSKAFPFKLNSGTAIFNTYSNIANIPLLVSFNTQHPEDIEARSTLDQKEIRMRWIDTNFNILNTKILTGGLAKILRHVKKVGEDKFLLVGAIYTDTIHQQLGAWACLIDTSGKLIWDRTYVIRDVVDHYLTDGVATKDGGYLLSGCVGGQTSKGTNQDAILIKIDSLGCLDTTGCYPLGLPKNNKQNIVINIYPNPTTNNVIIQMPNHLLGDKQIIIYDMQGKAIINQHIKNTTIELQSTAWVNGLYLVTIHFNNQTYHYKISKQ
jgi:Secretion system C-terminal sorting domain